MLRRLRSECKTFCACCRNIKHSKNPLINSAVVDSVGPIMATIDLFPVLLCVALVKDDS